MTKVRPMVTLPKGAVAQACLDEIEEGVLIQVE